MSVQFAQQTELVRLDKRACQKSTSMQTMQPGTEGMEEPENEESTPRASPSSSWWLEEVERLKTELEERNVVIAMLKKELQKIQSGPEQVRASCVCVRYWMKFSVSQKQLDSSFVFRISCQNADCPRITVAFVYPAII